MGAVVKIWLESLISMLTIKDSRKVHSLHSLHCTECTPNWYEMSLSRQSLYARQFQAIPGAGSQRPTYYSEDDGLYNDDYDKDFLDNYDFEQFGGFQAEDKEAKLGEDLKEGWQASKIMTIVKMSKIMKTNFLSFSLWKWWQWHFQFSKVGRGLLAEEKIKQEKWEKCQLYQKGPEADKHP